MKKGKLFVIEGLDGSGKQTQSELLEKKLISKGYKVKRVTFPNYSCDSSLFVKMYLNGDFGENPNDISPRVSSTFYALDRYVSFKLENQKFYDEGGIILCDRYTTSNMVHQACKIDEEDEKDKFLDWLIDLEFNIYNIPYPDKVFFLDIDPEVSMKLMDKRKNKITEQDKKDIHEKDFSHLLSAYKNSMYLIDKYSWEKVNCVKGGTLKSIEEINKDLYSKIIKHI